MKQGYAQKEARREGRAVGGMGVSVVVLRHVLELILGPCRDRMNVTVLVAHEVEISEWHGDWLCANAKKATDVNNGLASSAGTVDVIDLANLMIVGAVYCRPLQRARGKFCRGETDMVTVIHCGSSCSC
jgi:hypothetical protein